MARLVVAGLVAAAGVAYATYHYFQCKLVSGWGGATGYLMRGIHVYCTTNEGCAFPECVIWPPLLVNA